MKRSCVQDRVTGVPGVAIARGVRLREGASAFMVGLQFLSRVRAEVAWRAPEALRGRLGTLDPALVAGMVIGEVAAAISYPSGLHPWPRQVAANIVAASRFVVEEHHGDARRLWRGLDSADSLVAQLLLVPGIGKHKATVGAFLLIAEGGVRVANAFDLSELGKCCPKLLASYFFDS